MKRSVSFETDDTKAEDNKKIKKVKFEKALDNKSKGKNKKKNL